MTIIESTPEQPDHDSAAAAPGKPRLPFAVCVLLAAVLMFANYSFSIPLSFIPGTAELAARSQPFSVFWAALTSVVTLVTALVLTWLVTKYILRRRLRDIGWRWTKDSWWLFGVGWAASAFTVIVCTVVMPLTGWVDHTPIPPEEWHKLTAGAVVAVVITRIFSALALQGIPEELLWRGWLMHCLVQRPRVALLVSALVFGALHIVSSGGQQNMLERFIYLIPAFGFGFCAGALALRFRSLWPAIGVHGGLHLTNLILNFTPLNATGPVIWVSTAVVWLIIGIIALAGWKGTRVEMVR